MTAARGVIHIRVHQRLSPAEALFSSLLEEPHISVEPMDDCFVFPHPNVGDSSRQDHPQDAEISFPGHKFLQETSLLF